MKITKQVKWLLLISVLSLSSNALFSEEDPLLTETQNVINSEQIDIEGDWDAPDAPTPEEMLESARKQSEMKNVKMITNQIKNLKVSNKQVKKIKTDEKKKLEDKILNIFGTGPTAESDSVSVKEAAPVVAPAPVAPIVVPTPAPAQEVPVYIQEETSVEAPAPKRSSIDYAGDFKVTPKVGMTSIQGEDIDFESKASLGFDIEAAINPYVGISFGLNYTTLDATEIGTYSYNLYNYSGYSYYYNDPGYISTYSTNRELAYQNWNLNLVGKFYFTQGVRVKPYVGMGVGFGRSVLKYQDQKQYTNSYNVVYGNEEYVSNYVSGIAKVGTDFIITRNVGLNFDAMISKGMTGGIGSKSYAYNEDQFRLESIGSNIEESVFAALTAGVVVSF